MRSSPTTDASAGIESARIRFSVDRAITPIETWRDRSVGDEAPNQTPIVRRGRAAGGVSWSDAAIRVATPGKLKQSIAHGLAVRCHEQALFKL